MCGIEPLRRQRNPTVTLQHPRTRSRIAAQSTVQQKMKENPMTTSAAQAETRFDDLYVSNTWLGKHQRKTTLDEEVSAFSELSAILVATPQRALQRFLELSLTLCKAG